MVEGSVEQFGTEATYYASFVFISRLPGRAREMKEVIDESM